MNKTLTYILVGGASALVGAVTGYIFCKKRLSDIVEGEVAKRVDEELASIRRVNAEKPDKIGDENPPLEPEKDNEATDALSYFTCLFEGMASEAGVELNEYRMQVLRSKIYEWEARHFTQEEIEEDIAKLIKRYETFDNAPEVMTVNDYNQRCEDAGIEPDIPDSPSDDDPDEGDNSIYNPQSIMDDWAGRVEVVSIDDYDALPSSFDKVTYSYYEDDDVLIDDGNEMVDDVERTVGDALVHFGESDEMDDDTVYVVNGDYGLAIEIIRYHSSYSESQGWR